MECKLYHLNNLITTMNNNPSIWIKNDKRKGSTGIAPTNVFVNDNGDIVIEVPMDYVIGRDKDIEYKYKKKYVNKMR